MLQYVQTDVYYVGRRWRFLMLPPFTPIPEKSLINQESETGQKHFSSTVLTISIELPKAHSCNQFKFNRDHKGLLQALPSQTSE